MGQEVLKKFDRYFLLDCLAQGGMAEIFRARPAAMDSSGRFLVIKRILAGHGKNNDFIGMFRSETKVMMGFNHPNVIQLFDSGEAKGQPYIAMEYVDGKNLRQFLTKMNDRKTPIPIDVAVYIIEQAAAGLQYAHSYKDKITGEHLGIVHRDVSPQNILLSYDGNIKLIDFGIAKASTNAEATRVGVIKGKPSYLSPEQVRGKELDGKSDIFSLGAVLWEILVGKKLFAAPTGESEFAVLKLIESSDSFVKPPSEKNSAVPEELDAIVMKSLCKDREKRYQTAEEFQYALRKFLNRTYPDFNPSELSQALKENFKEAILDDRKRLQNLNSKAEQLLKEEIKAGADLTDPFKKVQQKQEFTGSGTAAKTEVPHKIEEFSLPSSSTADHRNFKVAENTKENIVVTENAASKPVIKAPMVSSQSEQQTADTFKMSNLPKEQTITQGTKSKIKIQRTRVSRPQRKKRPVSFFILSGSAVAVLLLVIAPELGIKFPPAIQKYLPNPTDHTVSVPVQQSRDPSGTASTPAPARDPKTIKLLLKVQPGFLPTKITLNGKEILETDPSAMVPLDSALELRVEREGFEKFVREFTLNSKDLQGVNEWVIDVPMNPMRFGYLSIRSTPSADVTITNVDGDPSKRLSLKTPVKEGRFPAGKYKIDLKNEVLGMEKTIIREIDEGMTVKIDERLDLK